MHTLSSTTKTESLTDHSRFSEKVTSELAQDVPILARNKLLERISPEVVDSLFGMLKSGLAQQANSLTFDNGEEFSMEEAFDLALPSRIDGLSFKVIPIAVYT